jgi:hypothetical protein
MKYSCELVKDLLPLYYDDVCSLESRKIVEEHLAECPACKSELQKYKNTSADERLSAERADVVGHHTKAVKRKSMVAGLCFSAILAVPILVCLIVNLATGHALDWFFIVLTSLMVLGSVTAVPLIVEKEKFLWTIGSFTASLLLLLLTTCLYAGGSWFFIAAIPVLFGLSLVFSPIVIHKLPLSGFVPRHKGLLIMAINTVWLYATVIAAGLYSHFDSFSKALLLTTVPALLPWILFAVIRYLKTNGWIRAGLCTIVSGVFLSLIQDVIFRIDQGIWDVNFLRADLFNWNYDTVTPNVYLLLLLTGVIAGITLIAIGMLRKNIGPKPKNNR